MLKRLVFTTALVTALPAHTLAQTPSGAASAKQAAGVEDIVVTAQRRGESLQKVPIAVAAISGASLARSGVADVGSLPAVAPGLIMTMSRASVTPYLRGVGTQSGDIGGSGAVAIYVDGVNYAAPAAGLFALNNVERIEVIKGPQGTLFGRNATGGLIHIITRDPSFTPTMEANIGYGNYKTFTGSAYASTGLTDNLALDFSLYGTHQGDGFGTNLVTGADAYFRREVALRSKLMWRPGDDTKVTLTGDYSNNHNDAGQVKTIAPGTLAIGGVPQRGSIYDTQINLPTKVRAPQWGVGLKIEQDLGTLTLTSLSAFRYVKSRANFDQDVTPAPVIDAVFAEATDTFQQEITVGGHSDWLDYTAGVFYMNSAAKSLPIQIRSATLGAQRLDRFVNQGLSSYAVFAQGTAKLTPSTRLTVGARYTIDKISVAGRDVAAAGNTSVPAGSNIRFATQDDTYKVPTWRLALDQDLTEGIMVYGSYSRGYKSAQYASQSFTAPPVRPEKMDAFEVGVKSSLFDRQLQLNVSAFHYNYRDIQLIIVQVGTPVIINAAGAKIKGLDFESTWVPRFVNNRFTLRAAGSFLDGHYTSFQNAPFYTPNPAGGLIVTRGDASGFDTIRSPKFSANVTADYKIPSQIGEFALSATYFHSSRFNFDPDGHSVQRGYDLLSGQISYTEPGEKWSVRLWGKNLTKTKYYVSWTSQSLGDSIVPGAPRTYGVTLGYKM
ncbi:MULTISPECIES: TonB-dependent receptor [Sphingobium]|uniref:TonB-dependent receptor n=1 Tax=Sphingobium TaxID=165695 RepID=UPI0021014CFA|nr:TonB-dependent receptor [Sphingobium sp. 15-1]